MTATAATQVTFSCPTHGVGVFHASDDTLAATARLLAGKTMDEARALVLEQPGFIGAQVTIQPADTKMLPNDPSKIAIIVVGVSNSCDIKGECGVANLVYSRAATRHAMVPPGLSARGAR